MQNSYAGVKHWGALLGNMYGHQAYYPQSMALISAGAACLTKPLSPERTRDCGCGAKDFVIARDGRTRCSYCHGQPR